MEHGGLALEGVTAGRKGIFERGERGEVRIDQRIVSELPEVFGGLQLGGVGGQEDQMHPLRDLHQRTGMIPRLIEHQHDALRGASAHRTGKRLQRHLHDGDVDGGGELPLAAPGGRMHKREQVEPLEAVLHSCDGPPSTPRPDRTQDRLEPESMLVGGPDLDGRGGMRRLDLRYLLAQSVCTKAV